MSFRYVLQQLRDKPEYDHAGFPAEALRVVAQVLYLQRAYEIFGSRLYGVLHLLGYALLVRQVYQRVELLALLLQEYGDKAPQLLGVERLLYVVVGAVLYALEPVARRVHRAYQYDGRVARVRIALYGLADVQSVLVWQHQVEYHEIRLVAPYECMASPPSYSWFISNSFPMESAMSLFMFLSSSTIRPS